MKQLFITLYILFISLTIFAQAPEKMNYQAIIRDNSNTLIVNQQITIRIDILQNNANGNAVYSELHQPTTNSGGLINIEIGNPQSPGYVILGNFATINWATGPYFIKTSVDPTGGLNYSIFSTNQLLSVPYALYAKTSETAYWDKSNNNIYNNNSNNIGIGTSTPTSKLNVNGQVTIDQKNFGGYGGLYLKGNVPGNNYPNIAFGIKNTSNNDVVGAMVQGDLVNNTVGSETVDLNFYTSTNGLSGLSSKMIIKGNGNIIANGKIGIGLSTPNYPLSFPTTLGEKICFYDNGSNNYGIGIQGATMQIHGAVATDDVAIGTGSSTNFTEKFRFNGEGSFAVNGNTGTPGKVLKSTGSGSSPIWGNVLDVNSSVMTNSTTSTSISSATTPAIVFGTSRTVSIPVGQNATVLYSANFSIVAPNGCNGLGCSALGTYRVFIDGVATPYSDILVLDNSPNISISNAAFALSSGTHTIDVRAIKNTTSVNNYLIFTQSSTAIAIPQ